MPNVATRVESFDGPLNVELGWLAIVFRENRIAAVLGPGRYSRFRLWRRGLTPIGLSVMQVRTASVTEPIQVNDVPLGDETFVDVAVTLRVALRIEGDPAEFFENLFGEFGLAFDQHADVMIRQLAEESLRGTPSSSDDMARELGDVRRTIEKRIRPSQVFQILEVVGLEVTRWDEQLVKRRDLLNELELREIRSVRELEIQAAEGSGRAAAALALARTLGADPMFFWDADAYERGRSGQREAIVSLLGQYGDNLALLAEVLGVDGASLSEVLNPFLPGHGVSTMQIGGRTQLGIGPGSATAPIRLSMDAEVALLSTVIESIRGGVYRELAADGGTLRLLVAVVDGSVEQPDVEVAARELLGEAVSVVIVPFTEDAVALAETLVSECTGLPVAGSDLAWDGAALAWNVPAPLVASAVEGTFLAETICDVFASPPLVPYA